MDILQEFSRYLQAADPQRPAKDVLATWLFERLGKSPESLADKVLHYEISINQLDTKLISPKELELGYKSDLDGNYYTFSADSESGQRLLNSLYHYSMSYEHQKWVRFVHDLRASDFGEPSQSD